MMTAASSEHLNGSVIAPTAAEGDTTVLFNGSVTLPEQPLRGRIIVQMTKGSGKVPSQTRGAPKAG